jgi:methionine salvage enolase-phosphatase E1
MYYKLSREAEEILEQKAKMLKTPRAYILSSMVMEFSRSSAEEKLQVLKWKAKARNKCISHLSIILEQVWNDGYNAGWLHFQARKHTSFLRLQKKFMEELDA